MSPVISSYSINLLLIAKKNKMAAKLIIFDYYMHIEKLILITYPYKILGIWILPKLFSNHKSKQKNNVIKKVYKF
jgi:hypothetical protein